MKLLENKFFRIVGLIIIIYLMFFANKESPESPAGRLANISIKEDGAKVINKVREVSKIIDIVNNPTTNFNNNALVAGDAAPDYIENMQKNSNEVVMKGQVAYGDMVTIKSRSFEFIGASGNKSTATSKKYGEESTYSFTVGKDEGNIAKEINYGIMGMKKGETRDIVVTENFSIENINNNSSNFSKDYRDGKVKMNFYEIEVVDIKKQSN